MQTLVTITAVIELQVPSIPRLFCGCQVLLDLKGKRHFKQYALHRFYAFYNVYLATHTEPTLTPAPAAVVTEVR